ncbi:MAG: hypothetical protein OXP12_02745 [Thaumarchaeota archaeon]|nr:hypothetical protein [Nitrososphaerota archaeon]MDE0526686.1 hypothetical protein [Nitrososphaerota archaeon]
MSDAPASDPGGGRDELVAMLQRTGALRLSDRREFRLASGEMSDHYFDLRLLCGDPDGIGAVSAALYGMMVRTGAPRSVGGIESGSISIAAAISHLSGQLHRRDPSSPSLPSFFVRKGRKGHGTQKMIEGVIESPAVVVEDVVTSGGSALRAVDIIRDAGYECDHLMCVVFRGSGAQQKEIEKSVKIRYLLRSDYILGRLRA